MRIGRLRFLSRALGSCEPGTGSSTLHLPIQFKETHVATAHFLLSGMSNMRCQNHQSPGMALDIFQ